MIYTTLLNPSFDLIYEIPESGKGTYLDVPSRFFPAGKGLNCAKVIAKLGEEVSLVSLMPSMDTTRFTSYLDSCGVTHLPYEIDGAVRVNTTVFEAATRSTVHYNSEGAHCTTQIQDKFFNFLEDRFQQDDTWLFSGSLPKGIESSFYESAVRKANSIGITTLLDSRGAAFEHGLQAIPAIITPNEDELESLFEEKIDGVQHLALKGKRLIDTGIGMVFITLGEDGVIALSGNECLLCKAPEIDVMDTVGCGDAFLAGLTVAMQRGFNFHEICRFAVACGTSNAAHLGPGEVEKDQVWHLMENVRVASL